MYVSSYSRLPKNKNATSSAKSVPNAQQPPTPLIFFLVFFRLPKNKNTTSFAKSVTNAGKPRTCRTLLTRHGTCLRRCVLAGWPWLPPPKCSGTHRYYICVCMYVYHIYGILKYAILYTYIIYVHMLSAVGIICVCMYVCMYVIYILYMYMPSG